MLYVSGLALSRWDCTMYVRISFAVGFILFVSGAIALRIQTRTFYKMVDLEIERGGPQLPNEIIIDEEVDDVTHVEAQQHPYHILPTSAWPFLTAYALFDMLFFTVYYFHYGLPCYTKRHLSCSITVLVVIVSI
jgi:hypothetical protein